jgi:hypothetical protein
MRIRTGVSAAAMAAALLLSAGAARAEGPASTTPPSIFGERFFSTPAVLGDSWSRAVSAALGEVARLLDDRATLQRAVFTPAAARRRAVAWQTPSVAGARELEPVRAFIELRPVLIEPPTQATGDVRGERAALLGAHVELPWSVP